MGKKNRKRLGREKGERKRGRERGRERKKEREIFDGPRGAACAGQSMQ